MSRSLDGGVSLRSLLRLPVKEATVSVHKRNARVTVRSVQGFKDRGERIPMLTCYKALSARILDEAGIPLLLVGDSLGMVVLGYDSTVPVTMEEMLHHTRAVSRGGPLVSRLSRHHARQDAQVRQGLRPARRRHRRGGTGLRRRGPQRRPPGRGALLLVGGRAAQTSDRL